MQVESRLPHEQRAPVVFNALPKFLPLGCKGIRFFFWRFLTGVSGIIFVKVATVHLLFLRR